MKCSRKFLIRREETFAADEELTHATARRLLRGAKLGQVGVRAGFGKRKYPVAACGRVLS
jgi:hypothetical protein